MCDKPCFGPRCHRSSGPSAIFGQHPDASWLSRSRSESPAAAASSGFRARKSMPVIGPAFRFVEGALQASLSQLVAIQLRRILRPVLDESGKPPAVWSLYLSCDSVATSRLSSEGGRGAVGTMRSHCCDNVASKSSRFPWLLFLSQKLMERNQSSA